MFATIERPFEDISYDYDASPGSILLTTLRVDGNPLHFQALRVISLEDENFTQRAADPVVQEQLDALSELYADTAFVTTELDGWDGQYVLYAVPFGD